MELGTAEVALAVSVSVPHRALIVQELFLPQAEPEAQRRQQEADPESARSGTVTARAR